VTSYFCSSASGAAGAQNGTSWANAFLTIAAALSGGRSAGDILFIGDDHVESTSGSQNWFFNNSPSVPSYMYVVDHTKPSPGPGDLKVGTPSGGYAGNDGNIIFNIGGYVYGLYVEAGIGSSATVSVQGGSSKAVVFDHCTFKCSSTNASARLYIPPSSCFSLHKDCTFIATHSTMSLTLSSHYGKFVNCTFSASATPLFLSSVSNAFTSFEGCDFSGYSGTKIMDLNSNGGAFPIFKDCKMPSGNLFSITSDLRCEQNAIWLLNCDSGATNYKTDAYHFAGELHTSTSVVRTGGASQGTAYSWQITTNANNQPVVPFQLIPLSIWNNTTGAAINVTVEGIADPRDFSALPNNDDIWFDVEALENASLPQGTYHVGTKTSFLGTGSALTASTAAWDSAATARANSTAYSAGDIIKVASNTGRLFVCTSAGTSGSTPPGGYATAVDGDTVTDGSATFKAMWRFKQTITTGTIGMAGLITVYPKVAKASLNGIYVDPFVTLT
jgi:hypothetical protein